MFKRLYEKSELCFALVCIASYCILMSVADALSPSFGIEKAVTFPVGLLLSVMLLFFLVKNGLTKKYGLCAPTASARSMLYYLPLFVMLTANLWYGIAFNYGALEAVLYILSMLAVGFLEEIIFRGLLFNAMRAGNPKVAVAVSSLTFGIGHIINLVNGSGAELLPSLLQVIYATAAGFMFVMIYYKTKSLILPIITHGLFNALSAFSNEAAASAEQRVFFSLLLTLITASYAVYIIFTLNTKKKNGEEL